MRSRSAAKSPVPNCATCVSAEAPRFPCNGSLVLSWLRFTAAYPDGPPSTITLPAKAGGKAFDAAQVGAKKYFGGLPDCNPAKDEEALPQDIRERALIKCLRKKPAKQQTDRKNNETDKDREASCSEQFPHFPRCVVASKIKVILDGRRNVECRRLRKLFRGQVQDNVDLCVIRQFFSLIDDVVCGLIGKVFFAEWRRIKGMEKLRNRAQLDLDSPDSPRFCRRCCHNGLASSLLSGLWWPGCTTGKNRSGWGRRPKTIQTLNPER
jgi:hypothetical protein